MRNKDKILLIDTTDDSKISENNDLPEHDRKLLVSIFESAFEESTVKLFELINARLEKNGGTVFYCRHKYE